MRQPLVVLISTVCTLIVLEIVLRLFWTPPELNPRFRRRDIQWMEENVVYNSYGYRDREFTEERPPGVFRIYSLGDSYTFGWYLPDPKQTYPKLLEKELKETQGLTLEVINAASPGFSVKEEVDRFLSEGRQFSPDLVTIGVNFGDFVTVRPFPSVIPPYAPLLNKSYVYRLTVGALVKRIESQRRYTFLMDIFQNSNSQDWQEFARLMLRLNKEANSINARLAIILFPYLDPQNPDQPYPWQPMHKRLEEFTKQHGITLVDPLGLYLAHPDKRDLVLNPIDAHPTAVAHRFVTQELLRSFDFKTYFATGASYVPKMRSVLLRSIGDTIPPHASIRSISSNRTDLPWTYYEDKQGTIHSAALRDLTFRQSPIYPDTLEVFKPASAEGPGNTIGASMKYHVLAKNQRSGEIRIPTSLYGFLIVGIENIQGLYMEKDGGTVREFIRPTRIEKAGDAVLIQFHQAKPYYVYQLELAAGVKQMTFSTKGEVTQLTKTILLQTKLVHEAAVVRMPSPDPIIGLPQLTVASESFAYAFVNGVLTKINSVQTRNQDILLTFAHALPTNSEISLPVAINYTMEAGEVVTLTLEQ